MTRPIQLEQDMPGAGYGETLREVLDAHGLSHEEASRGTGIARSTVTRILSGQFSVPPELTQWLWRKTRDPRVLVVALGDDAADRLIEVQAASTRRYDDRRNDAIMAMGRVSQRLFDADPRAAKDAITTAINELADLARLVERPALEKTA